MSLISPSQGEVARRVALIDEAGAQPAAGSAQLILFTDDVAGEQELFYDNPSRGPVQLTSGGALNVPAGVTAFKDLDDTPASFAGSASYLVRVNATPDGLEFLDPATDFLSQYALLAGRAGGQVLVGATGAAGRLTLRATADPADGPIVFETDPTTERARIATTGQWQVGTTAVVDTELARVFGEIMVGDGTPAPGNISATDRGGVLVTDNNVTIVAGGTGQVNYLTLRPSGIQARHWSTFRVAQLNFVTGAGGGTDPLSPSYAANFSAGFTGAFTIQSKGNSAVGALHLTRTNPVHDFLFTTDGDINMISANPIVFYTTNSERFRILAASNTIQGNAALTVEGGASAAQTLTLRGNATDRSGVVVGEEPLGGTTTAALRVGRGLQNTSRQTLVEVLTDFSGGGNPSALAMVSVGKNTDRIQMGFRTGGTAFTGAIATTDAFIRSIGTVGKMAIGTDGADNLALFTSDTVRVTILAGSNTLQGNAGLTVQGGSGVHTLTLSGGAGAASTISIGASDELIGFYGVAAVARGAALTAEDSSVIDSTYDATEEGVLNNVRTRVGEIEARLQALGLIN